MASTTRTSAFDIRLIIALLTGTYGLVITIMGLFVTTDKEIDKSAGVNINLWAGLGLLVLCALFVLWTRLRPLRVPVSEEATTEDPQ
jgi:hypothetical protein